MISPEAILVLDRLSFYAAAVALFGVQSFIVILTPAALGTRLAAGAEGWLKAASLVAVLSCILSVPATTAMVGGGWDRALDGQTLTVLLLETSVGHALLARTGLAFLVMFLLLARVGTRRLNLAVAALLLTSLSLSGHARMDTGAREVIHVANHVVHLLSGGFWIGSLAILPACLGQLRDPTGGAEAKVALRRFSFCGHVAVALVILTGVVNSALILGYWPSQQSPYQWLLLAKIALVATMAGIAVVNRYRFVPRIRDNPESAIASIRFGTHLELGVSAGVLAIAAAVGVVTPK